MEAEASGGFEAEARGGPPHGRHDGRRGRPGGGGAVARGRWGRAEAVLAAGTLVAMASLLVAAWLMRPVTTGIDAAAIRAAVEQAAITDVYRAWRSLAISGVARGATPDEDRVRRMTRNRATLAVAIGLLGAIGGLAAVGAAAAIVARGRLGGPDAREFTARTGS